MPSAELDRCDASARSICRLAQISNSLGSPFTLPLRQSPWWTELPDSRRGLQRCRCFSGGTALGDPVTSDAREWRPLGLDVRWCFQCYARYTGLDLEAPEPSVRFGLHAVSSMGKLKRVGRKSERRQVDEGRPCIGSVAREVPSKDELKVQRYQCGPTPSIRLDQPRVCPCGEFQFRPSLRAADAEDWQRDEVCRRERDGTGNRSFG